MKTTEKICYNCGKKMHTSEQYHWHDEFLGDFTVPCKREEYSYCDCGEERLAYSLCLKIEDAEQERIEQLLLQSVGDDMKAYKANLVRNKELVELLGKSRQAIQQDHRIRTLIYHHVEKSGEMVYWKPSVEQYKATGDGRFDLRQYFHVKNTDTIKKVQHIAIQECSTDSKSSMMWTKDDAMSIRAFPFFRQIQEPSSEKISATFTRENTPFFINNHIGRKNSIILIDFNQAKEN